MFRLLFLSPIVSLWRGATVSLHNTQGWRASSFVHEILTCTTSASLGEGSPASIKKNEIESNALTPQLKE